MTNGAQWRAHVCSEAPHKMFFFSRPNEIVQQHFQTKKLANKTLRAFLATEAVFLIPLWPKITKKRPKQGSSSSVDEEDVATSNCESLRSSIDSLNKVVADGFANIHSDIDNLCLQLKTEIDGIKRTIKDIKKSLESTQEDVEVVKEDVKKVTEDLSKSTNTLNEKIVKLEQFSKTPEVTEALNAKIAELETQLKQQIEDNLRLEQ